MKLGITCLGLLVATAVAHAQRNKSDTEAVTRACSVAECFNERDIRSFEVIDQTHLIVYTGSQRCAFHVELRGTLCDLTFAPELHFRRSNELPDGRMPARDAAGNRGLSDPFDSFETARRERRDLRVCSNDLTVQVHGGRFTESLSGPGAGGVDRFGEPRIDAACRVANVTSITDDQLVEFFVARGVVPPLPPMGTGEIQIGEQEEQEEGARRDAPQSGAETP